jgi:hypothetical protein
MYTKEQDEDVWAIFDPNGMFICYVTNEYSADALLSHLNK